MSGFQVGREPGVCRHPSSSLLSSGTGVMVNAVHPGVARTELGRHTGMHSSAFSSFTLGKPPPGLGSLSGTPALTAWGLGSLRGISQGSAKK